MNSDEIRTSVEQIAREVFDDETIVVTDSLGKDDLKSWDSLGHIRLITATEEAFGISFTIEEIEGVSSMGQLLRNIAEKTS